MVTPFLPRVTIFIFAFVFTNLFLFDCFAYDLFLCYDYRVPSLPLGTYPKFTVVITVLKYLDQLLPFIELYVFKVTPV